MFSKKLGVIFILLIALAVPAANADIFESSQYMATYFDYSPTATEKVLFGTDFQDTDYTYFDTDEFLAGPRALTFKR